MNKSRRQVRAHTAVTLDPNIGTIEDAVLTLGGDPSRILAVGSGRSARKGEPGPVTDLGEVVIAPGLVNAHTHVANAHLKGRLLGKEGFAAWCRSLRSFVGIEPDRTVLGAALEEMRGNGTCLAADMSDIHCLHVAACENKAEPELLYAVQHFGFDDPRENIPELRHLVALRRVVPDRRVTLAGRALYSTHPETLRRAHKWCTENKRPFFLHLAESMEETRQLCHGDGELADLFRWAGILPASYNPPGCSPTAYANHLGLLGPNTVAVHCVQLDDDDLRLLAETGTTVCLCPRSNHFIGVGRARFEDMLNIGMHLCLGTDGLGSVPDLNMWNELIFLMEGSKAEYPLEGWLALSSRNGAKALGFESDYGRLATGCRAIWSVVPDRILELSCH